jgi:hypothetical protein
MCPARGVGVSEGVGVGANAAGDARTLPAIPNPARRRIKKKKMNAILKPIPIELESDFRGPADLEDLAMSD